MGQGLRGALGVEGRCTAVHSTDLDPSILYIVSALTSPGQMLLICHCNQAAMESHVHRSNNY